MNKTLAMWILHMLMGMGMIGLGLLAAFGGLISGPHFLGWLCVAGEIGAFAVAVWLFMRAELYV